MPKITIMENEDASLWFHTESKIVHHKMHRFMSPGALQQLLNTGADCLEKYKATKWISDDRENSVVRPEDVEWSQTIWIQRAIRLGFKHWAVVMPVKVIGQMQMRKISDEYSRLGVVTRLFEDVDEGMRWLESIG